MADANVTAARVRELFHYDPRTGVLTRALPAKNNAIKAGSVVGSLNSDGYLSANVDHTSLKVHRIAWLHFYGTHPTGQIDHINGRRTDNRISNLRDVVPALNTQNIRSAPSGKRSGLPLGVALSNRKERPYRAQIRIDGKLTFIGEFKTADAAHGAYVDAKRRVHPGFTL